MIAHVAQTEKKHIEFTNLKVGQVFVQSSAFMVTHRLRIDEYHYILRNPRGDIEIHKAQDWPTYGVIGTIQDVKMIWEI